MQIHSDTKMKYPSDSNTSNPCPTQNPDPKTKPLNLKYEISRIGLNNDEQLYRNKQYVRSLALKIKRSLE